MFFLLLFLIVGFLATRSGIDSERSYLLGDRSFGKWMIGLSAGATANTSFILIAAVGLGYTQGFAAYLFNIAYGLGDIVFWAYFAHAVSERTSETGADTAAKLVAGGLPEESSNSVRSLVAPLIIVFVGAYLVAQLVGSAKILHVYFNTDLEFGVLASLALILLYCTTGGLRASIWTDVLQALLMMFLTVGITIYALIDVGGWSALISGLKAVDPSLLQVTRGHTSWSLVGYFVGYAVMGVGFGLSAPHITIRLMAGRSADEVKQARWIYLPFIYGTASAMMLFGICCRVLLPEIGDPEQALAVYSVAEFSPWLVGAILAGAFATIASSADSQLLSCSSALALDLFPKTGRSLVERYGVTVHYGATILTGLTAAGIALYSSATVFELVIFSISVLASSLGAAMFIRLLKRPTCGWALNASMSMGVFVALLWRFFELHNVVSDVVPGITAAIITHEVIMRIRRANMSV